MLKPVLFILFLFTAFDVAAQQLIPFQFTSEEDNRMIKENDSMKYYVANGDSTNVVAIDEENTRYKLYNKDHRLIADGAYIADGEKYLQDGRWTERYDNGKMKTEGSFRRGAPMGTWQEYYTNGKLKVVYNYGIFDDNGAISTCLSGSYQEYYQNGKLKVNGFYSSKIVNSADTERITDPVTDQVIKKIVQRKDLTAEKAGHWEYYTESGELDKKDEQ